MKVAIVCDWLTNIGGAEKVLLAIHKLYPEAPIYTSKYSEKGIDWFKDAEVRTGWLQIFPSWMRRILGPLRQRWFSHLDLSEYDLIISVTGAEAKAVKSGKRLHEEGKKSKNPNGIHISYCHVPTQYYWQMYDDYVENPGFGILNPLVRFFFKLLVKPLRKADYRAAQSPDYFVTISEYAQELMKRYYKREAIVIHPPVEIDAFSVQNDVSEEDYYITTSRQVNWKRIDLAVKACMKMNRKLLVVGEGPEHNNLVKMSNGSDLVKFVPLVGKKKLAKYLAGAKGYLFPSLEPFGIAPVEALAVGCPVIAFGEGGARDYVMNGENGILFEKQTIKSLVEAIEKFEKMKFEREKIAKTVENFKAERFDQEVRDYVKEKVG
ncbi:MAG: glycosyltransferase [Candidatus Saccharibacteria bacterium]|nr:glycosyltransferase [Candidatus Saccharibacteria bacterium]